MKSFFFAVFLYTMDCGLPEEPKNLFLTSLFFFLYFFCCLQSCVTLCCITSKQSDAHYYKTSSLCSYWRSVFFLISQIKRPWFLCMVYLWDSNNTRQLSPFSEPLHYNQTECYSFTSRHSIFHRTTSYLKSKNTQSSSLSLSLPSFFSFYFFSYLILQESRKKNRTQKRNKNAVFSCCCCLIMHLKTATKTLKGIL